MLTFHSVKKITILPTSTQVSSWRDAHYHHRPGPVLRLQLERLRFNSTMTKAQDLILENRLHAQNFRFPEPPNREPPPVSYNPHPKRRRSHQTPAQTPDNDAGNTAPTPTTPMPTARAPSTALIPTTQSSPPSPPPTKPPWRAYRVISGHQGWPRCIAFDPSNHFFATGGTDRTIKLWNSATGKLKLTLTGHVSALRAIKFSQGRPYMFTASEDKSLKCWDLERNSVIRTYHGHLSAIYSLALHPQLDVAMTGGRDSTVRVWDIRSRRAIFVLGGHRDTVQALLANEDDPQIVSGSADRTIRLWDLAAGKTISTLTHHKKGIRALARHPTEFSFISAGADALRTWALPAGVLMRVSGGGLTNCVDVNQDGVTCVAEDDGGVEFWEFEKGERICRIVPKLQPGSLEAEKAVLACGFDRSGSRVVTCHADKTVRMWKEDEEFVG